MSMKKSAKIKEDEADRKLRETLGKKIRIARDRLNQSAEVVANKIGISRSGLTQIEKGNNNVNAIMLWKIACALHCKVTDLFPEVPDSRSLYDSDIENIKKDNEQAA